MKYVGERFKKYAKITLYTGCCVATLSLILLISLGFLTMPKKYSTQQRLSHIPKMGTELTHDVRILWNEYQVP